VALVVSWKVKGAKLHVEETVARDVGRGGLKFPSPQALEVGTSLYLIIDLAGDQVITPEAEVVWVHEVSQHGGPQYEIGVKFTEISPDDYQHLLVYCDRLPVSQRRT